MIKGIGTDIVRVERIKHILDRQPRFSQRVLHVSELQEFEALTDQKASWLAKRFAAKEATLKALGTGLRNGICFEDIMVFHSDKGQPHIRLQAKALEFFTQLGAQSIHVSISDESKYAIAFVVID